MVDGEIVIVDLRTGRIHHLNATATCIWQNCIDAALPQIAARVAAAFASSPSPSALVQDVRDALARFEQLGLLHRLEGDARI